MPADSINPFGSRARVRLGTEKAAVYRLGELARQGVAELDRLPFSIRVLLENALRHAGRGVVSEDHVRRLGGWHREGAARTEIPFMPARVVLQDFTGVPCVVDLAAMRDAMARMKGDPDRINPVVPCDLVIDHSVQVDHYGSGNAFRLNVELEMDRNRERYQLLKFAQRAFHNFRVVPPGTGIVHQVNLEYLAPVVQLRPQFGELTAYPDTLVATDLVLQVTQMLRKHGVVDKFVEFYGPGLSSLGLADRATIANMSPEYGATMGFFPVDAETLRYLERTGRSREAVERVERYCKEQGLFRTDATPDPVFSATLELDLSTIVPSLAGPRRPQDRVPPMVTGLLEGNDISLHDGAVVIAAITSCTNTSNPSVMIGAGLLAKKAVERGLDSKPWVKTSLAPGSTVVTDYLEQSGLTEYLDKLGFNLVGYGCTTCIGNSGPLPEAISEAVNENQLVVCSVLSGNRNFEGRINQDVRNNYLASPPLCVAYALAGRMDIDILEAPLGEDSDGEPVYLRELWPSSDEIKQAVADAVRSDMFTKNYADVFKGDERWRGLETP